MCIRDSLRSAAPGPDPFWENHTWRFFARPGLASCVSSTHQRRTNGRGLRKQKGSEGMRVLVPGPQRLVCGCNAIRVAKKTSMKKISSMETAAAAVGIDLGDRWSHFCVLGKLSAAAACAPPRTPSPSRAPQPSDGQVHPIARS